MVPRCIICCYSSTPLSSKDIPNLDRDLGNRYADFFDDGGNVLLAASQKANIDRNAKAIPSYTLIIPRLLRPRILSGSAAIEEDKKVARVTAVKASSISASQYACQYISNC
jgi:hypothetical protein